VYVLGCFSPKGVSVPLLPLPPFKPRKQGEVDTPGYQGKVSVGRKLTMSFEGEIENVEINGDKRSGAGRAFLGWFYG